MSGSGEGEPSCLSVCLSVCQRCSPWVYVGPINNSLTQLMYIPVSDWLRISEFSSKDLGGGGEEEEEEEEERK